MSLVKISKETHDKLTKACLDHPLKPSLKSATERGIDLVIIEFEKDKRK